MKEKIETLIQRINIEVKESDDQENLITKYHTKFDFTINYNNVCYASQYQCNLNQLKAYKEYILHSVLYDAMCYEECNTSDDSIENLENFRLLFGYENIKDLINVYRGCKNAYDHVTKMFTKNEKDMLIDYFEEKGVL